jgi:hypothetical protein
VSAQVSPSDLKLALAFATASRVLSRSRVDQASLSSFVTRTVSPGSSEPKHRSNAVLLAEYLRRPAGLERFELSWRDLGHPLRPERSP